MASVTQTASKPADSPGKPPSPQNAPAQAAPLPSISDLLFDKYAEVKDLAQTDPASLYPWRATCKKCAWHTHQHLKSEAVRLIAQHALTHWRDIPVGSYRTE